MVPNCPWCQIVRGAKLSMVPNCPRCQIVRGAKLSILHYGAKLSVVPNCPRCQIVRGAKLSGAKLSVVPNCPRCQIVLVPNCPGAKFSPVPNCLVPNCPWCQIVRGAKLSGAKLSAVPNCPIILLRWENIMGDEHGSGTSVQKITTSLIDSSLSIWRGGNKIGWWSWMIMYIHWSLLARIWRQQSWVRCTSKYMLFGRNS